MRSPPEHCHSNAILAARSETTTTSASNQSQKELVLEMRAQSSKEWFFLPLFRLVLHGRLHVRIVESCSVPGTTKMSKIRRAGRSPNVICLPSENSKTSRFGRKNFGILKAASPEVKRRLLSFGKPKQNPAPIR
jgi:hypothetical protein